MMMMMIRAQLRIKLDNCVCGEASAPIGQMMQIILMRQLAVCLLFVLCTIKDVHIYISEI